MTTDAIKEAIDKWRNSYYDGPYKGYPKSFIDDAADLISTLQRENERLRGERESLQTHNGLMKGAIRSALTCGNTQLCDLCKEGLDAALMGAALNQKEE